MINSSLAQAIVNPNTPDPLQAFQRGQAIGKKRKTSSLAGRAIQGDADAFSELQTLDPEVGLAIGESIRAASAKDVNDFIRDAKITQGLLSSDPNRAAMFLQNRIQGIDARGGDSAETRAVLEQINNGDYQGAMDNITAFVSAVDGTKAPRTQVVDGRLLQENQDGTWSDATPNAGNREPEKLDAKDVAAINDKVSGLIKPTLAIYESAQSLASLEQRGSPAAKLAAVFKFMKANDPTSTVRQGEFDMVVDAEGAMKGFATKVNALMGEGGLSITGFEDLVNTAKALANSSVSQSSKDIDSYLDVIRPNLSVRQYEKMTGRMPGLFEVKSYTGPAREVKSKEDYDLLPPGSLYMEDGEEYRKPKL